MISEEFLYLYLCFERNMSYLVKFQLTPALFDFVLNHSKHGTIYYSLSTNFHRSSLIFRNNVQEFSTYISVLNTLPLKNNVSKKKEHILPEDKDLVLQKLIQILKNNSKTTSKTGITSLKKALLLAKKSKNNYNFESTKSYDPNLLDHNLEVEKFFKDRDNSKSLQNNVSFSSSLPKKSQEIPRDKLVGNIEQANKSNSSDNMKEQQNGLNIKESNLLKEDRTANMKDSFKFLNMNEINQLQSEEKFTPKIRSYFQEDLNQSPKKEDLQLIHENLLFKQKRDVNFQNDMNFENFSAYLTPYNKSAQLLLSSLDIYITNDMVLEGFKMLKNFRKKIVWKNIVKEEIKTSKDVYNLLLHGLSEKKKWDLMQQVIKWMAFDKIRLNSESFAALFYCLAGVKEFKDEKLVQKEINNLINQLFVNSISLDDIFSKAILSKEKAEKILALIQEVIPFFDIQPVTINLSSDCPLIKNLLMVENNLESPVSNIDIDTLKDLVEEQLFLENKFLIEVKAVSRGYRCNSSCDYKKMLFELKEGWRKCLDEALQKILKLNTSQNLKQPNLYIYLNSLPLVAVVDIMMEMALNLMEFSRGYSPSTAHCSLIISNRIAYRYQTRKKLMTKNIERTKELFNHYLSWYLNPNGPARNHRQKWQMLIQISDRMSQLDSQIINWPEDMKKTLGRFLLDLIIKELKFPLEEMGETKYYPVLCTILRYRNGTWREEIKCHPNISNLFQKVGFETLFFQADHLPMVCPPKPWKSVNHGGYLILPSDFIRRSFFNAGKVLRLDDIPIKNLYPTLDALNMLQGIPWMINEPVLDVALEVFRKGGSEKLGVPHFPESVEVENINTNEQINTTFKDRMAEQLLRKKLSKKRCEDYSLWVESLYRLSLANHYRKRLFWLPQNCDFRGRVYPIPSLLNHLGADLYRSLLKFGKGKPLGPKGLDWLKIHVINLTGTHKRKTVLERLAYANEILPLIIDSAENPLTGYKWWMESDGPWQTLATSMEIKKALSTPNPENYICKLPIHQDGSCNGLQHYAGLGKDLIGAQSVNLSSLKTPQDVYSAVANLIEIERAKDAEKGVEVALKLGGFIERKVIKQTVMTTVYGVTPYGAKIQISKRLEEIENFSQEYVKPAAAYLTDKTFLCLKKMFTSAKEIQEWLVNCADAISSLNEYVQWVSPMGLPVLQSYGKIRMNPNLNKVIVLPDKLKQKNAFPPNFIHSLDSSHMMLTALYCEQAGVTFAAVHDCFWTHPNSVDLMNKICREQFISLHSQPILENLSQFFVRQYLQNNILSNKELTAVFEAVPEKGSFDIKEVLNSVYFFS